eukprot:CAMPEP_0177646442 /NCGR_PEP_ID=MMETSP0447-20121125/9776_1 /TAXON_ID=0 /ORGANISM="Stygamoeba regulata, Strain BSH-02190019" /LENGTH=317 /DNA_ID=CAMNT_0019148975 /DNA_START=128 /DNA_END=1081 /DNA_ORIENTATION=-
MAVPKPAFAELVCLKQGCDEKKANHNGKAVHTVVKNAPFMIVLGLNHHPNVKPNEQLNFSRLSFNTSLVYDAEEPPYTKQVDFVKVKPVEHKAKVSGQGSQVILEVRLKVLTSQHENSLFRVKITAFQTSTNEGFTPELSVYSDAIKVMSKPEQIMKKAHLKKKRSVEDSLADTVTRLLDQQKQQEQLIHTLLEAVASSSKKRKVEAAPEVAAVTKVEKNSFESCFNNLINSYEALASEERPSKVRRVIRNTPVAETTQVNELLGTLQTEVNTLDVGFPTQAEMSSFCCPYPTNEVETLDEFYKDFLAQPLFIDLMI